MSLFSVRGGVRLCALSASMSACFALAQTTGNPLPATPSDPTNADNALTLKTVKVVDSALESAAGPVGSVVAKRSATGTKTDTPLRETPMSISVITREQIDHQKADSLDQAFEYTAGVFSLGGGANRRGSTGFTIRGFNVTGSAPLYVNGSKFPINSLSGAIEPYGYERLEVLKGPASILYGQAAPGGIINVVSKRPTAEPLREIEVQAGSYDKKQLAADFAGPIDDTGKWGYRVSGLVRKSDTAIDYIDDDRQFIAPTVVWKRTDDTTLTLLGTYYKNSTVYDYGKPVDGSLRFNPNGTIPKHRFIGEPGFNDFDTEGTTGGYLFEHNFTDNITFRQNALYFDYETYYADVSTGALNATKDSISRSAYTRNDSDKGFSVDNQLQLKLSTGVVEQTILLGVDYVDRAFVRVQRSGAQLGALNLFNPVYGSPVAINPNPVSNSLSTAKQLGGYVQDHIKIDGHWVLLLGGRWDDASNDTRNRASDAKTEFDSNAFTWRTGLLYLFDNGISPYFSYSESFQPQTGTDYFLAPYKPTTGQQYEVGVKYEPVGYNAAITVSAYQLTQQNVLTSDLDHLCSAVPTPTPCGNYSVQTGEVRSRGVEIEGRASLSNNLDLIVALARTDPEITKSNGVDLGRKLWSSPDRMASLWADYTVRNGVADGLGFGAGMRYTGQSYSTDNAIVTPGNTVYDAAIRYQIEHLHLSLNVKNVFDKDYIASCTFSCFYGDERTVDVSAKYTW
ncbi:MAG: TonB-dependent siderophore receptor family protein 6 [Verrucomicrobiaceae bacterium]|nr:TonB-dependent siderophore receptor family protein 6 [Verrucomicrobiaceae bacterium]